MKHRMLAIALAFFFGIATYILIRKVGLENAKSKKGTADQVVKSSVNKLINTVNLNKNNPAKN